MRSSLALITLAAAAQANTILGFEELVGSDFADGPPAEYTGQPYPSYFTLTTNHPFWVLISAQYATEGSQFIAGGPETIYDFKAVSGVSLLGVSINGIEGRYDTGSLGQTAAWANGTIVATISLFGGAAGTTLLSSIDVGIPANNSTATSYLFSNYTATEVTRFVIADTLTGDTGGFAVDRIVVNGGGAVPEPSTYGLALGGLALAVVAMRRRASKSSK